LKFEDVGFCGRRKARTNNKLNPNMAPGGNRARATLVGGEQFRHRAIPGPHLNDGHVSVPNSNNRIWGTFFVRKELVPQMA